METNTYKVALVAEAAELEKQLGNLGSLDHTVTGDWVSTPGEAMAAEADESLIADRVEEALTRDGELAPLETRYADVVRALEKITTGTFGSCEICHADIETDRLTANPAARTCKAHLNDDVDLAM
jgi:DnaK suppressor protein